MARWERTKKHYLVKTRRMTDGELLHALLGRSSSGFTEFDDKIYEVLKEVRSASSKAMLWIIGTASFGILSHFQVLRAVSASGLDVAPEIFSHAALVALSVSTAAYCFSYSKQTYLDAWFGWKLKNGAPAQKAECLLRYPDAYWHFAYLPGNIGFPKHILGSRSLWPQVIYLIFFLLSVLIFAAGSIWLWIVLAIDVWVAPNIGISVSLLTIILSAMIGLLGWTSPFYYDVPRRYAHNGLVMLLARRQGAKLSDAHVRVYRAAVRMGLIDAVDR